MESHFLEKILKIAREKGIKNLEISFGRQVFDVEKPYSYVRYETKDKKIVLEEKSNSNTFELYKRAKRIKKELNKEGIQTTLFIGNARLTKDIEKMIYAEKNKKED